MKKFAVGVLILTAVLLLLYPLWGLLSPQSYAPELMAHYSYGEGATMEQVQRSAALLWLSNGVLALGLIVLSLFLLRPGKLTWLKLAGYCLVLYPFVRAAVVVLSGLNLTSHIEDAEVALQISSEHLFYLVVGIALLGLASVQAKLQSPLSEAMDEPA
ncbi:hypothetical protein [Ferrimonas marina]|uniref:DUF2975 domain-containing protein n=1 Tax=Ferrimonas marina TaxID=299255 RepID=A0A1M5P5W0_9GAMM|nr:hypothetical protein [Ferrimonas marina]SHG97105.1 hypothetical protein SAMN02745129_1298 [Ferrimonas marina]